MAVFYQGHTLAITSDAVEVWSPLYRRFSIRDLREIYVFRGVASPVIVRGIGASAVTLVATAVSWQFLQSMAVLLVGGLVVLATSMVATTWMRTSRPPWELRALYRGEDVQLYSTPDALTFGQVKRALVRAIEASDREIESWR